MPKTILHEPPRLYGYEVAAVLMGEFTSSVRSRICCTLILNHRFYYNDDAPTMHLTLLGYMHVFVTAQHYTLLSSGTVDKAPITLPSPILVLQTPAINCCSG